jgi:hypothetical protein
MPLDVCFICSSEYDSMSIHSRVCGDTDMTRGDGFVEVFIASGLSHSEPRGRLKVRLVL